MTHGESKARNYRLAALQLVGWHPCQSDEEIAAEFRHMVTTIHKSGMSTGPMARLLNVSWSMVHTELLAAGVELKRGGQRPKHFVILDNQHIPLIDACASSGINYMTVMTRARNKQIRPWQAFDELREKVACNG